MFQTKMACSQSFIAFSRVSGRYVKYVPTQKVHKFRLAISARLNVSYEFFSSFLFSNQYNEQLKTISRVLRAQGHIVPTNSDLSTMYILRRIVCFQRRYKKDRLDRFVRSQSCIHFLQFPTCRYKTSFNIWPSWYHEQNEPTQRLIVSYRQKYATYQQNTEKNRTFSTQNTKILARRLAIMFICFQVGIVFFFKGGGMPINYDEKTGDSASPILDPQQGLYVKFQREKLQFLPPDDHLEGPYLIIT